MPLQEPSGPTRARAYDPVKLMGCRQCAEDKPSLLAAHRDQWVAYVGNMRMGIAKDIRTLIRQNPGLADNPEVYFEYIDDEESPVHVHA